MLTAIPGIAAERIGQKLEFHNGDQYQYSLRHFSGRDDTIPGEPSCPHPTLENLAIEWPIQGDDDLDGRVGVRYRKTGEEAWREGLSLRRVPAMSWQYEQNGRKQSSWTWRDRHAGSIFNLEPGTKYEINLRLEDPDGGRAERSITASTRPVPRPMPGAPVKRASTKNFAVVLAAVQPGDIIELEPGNYGFLEVPRDGLPGKPIVIRNLYGDAIYLDGDPSTKKDFSQPPTSREGEAVIEGASLHNRRHVHLEGLVSLGPIAIWNAESCVIRRCRVYGMWGITVSSDSALSVWQPALARRLTPYPTRDTGPRVRATDCYIADNIVLGISPWQQVAIGSKGRNMGEGIEITGPGNVICHNRVAGFRDCISTMEGAFTVEQNCIDITNNDIEAGVDDGIEFDYYVGNCRALRNRIANCHRGISAGPGFGGPIYIARNVFYNTLTRAIDPNRAGSGAVILHNTVVKSGLAADWSFEHSHAFARNNLMLGGGAAERDPGLTIKLQAQPVAMDLDYNGYGHVGGPLQFRAGDRRAQGIDALRTQTTDRRAVLLGLDVFAARVEIPAPPFPAHAVPDLRLSSGSSAVDAGQPLPNINDGCGGKAPDLGAYEFGTELPIYGPRPMGKD